MGTNTVQYSGEKYNGVFEESALTSIDFPSTLKRIEYCAFKKCCGLTNVKLNENLQVICNQAFNESGLKTIVIPKYV